MHLQRLASKISLVCAGFTTLAYFNYLNHIYLRLKYSIPLKKKSPQNNKSWWVFVSDWLFGHPKTHRALRKKVSGSIKMFFCFLLTKSLKNFPSDASEPLDNKTFRENAQKPLTDVSERVQIASEALWFWVRVVYFCERSWLELRVQTSDGRFLWEWRDFEAFRGSFGLEYSKGIDQSNCMKRGITNNRNMTSNFVINHCLMDMVFFFPHPDKRRIFYSVENETVNSNLWRQHVIVKKPNKINH